MTKIIFTVFWICFIGFLRKFQLNLDEFLKVLTSIDISSIPRADHAFQSLQIDPKNEMNKDIQAVSHPLVIVMSRSNGKEFMVSIIFPAAC